MRFTRYKNFINPSRLSPTEVNIYYTSNDRKKSILQCNYKTAICLSVIYTCDSFLLSPSTDKLCNKYLSGCFHMQEYQRFEGFACMVFNRPAMLLQIKQGAVQFNTLGSSYAKGMCSCYFDTLILIYLFRSIFSFKDSSKPKDICFIFEVYHAQRLHGRKIQKCPDK